MNYDPLSEEEVDRNMNPNSSGRTSSSTSISLKSVNTTVTAHQISLGATTVTSTSTGDIAPPTGQHAPLGQAKEDTKGRTVPGQSQQELKHVLRHNSCGILPRQTNPWRSSANGLCDNTFNNIQDLYSSANPRLRPAGG